MSPKDAMKNRLPVSKMRDSIVEFCKDQPNMDIAMKIEGDFPLIEKGNYKYIGGKHILMLVRTSRFINVMKDGDCVSGLIFDKNGEGLKMTKRLYGNFKAVALDTTAEILQEAAKEDKLYKKMLTHGARFFELKMVDAKVFFSGGEIYDLDADMNPTFSKYGVTGNERFENSRMVLMEYADREVVFNVIVEDGVYYALTSKNSNKIGHIESGAMFKFYDGADNHFTAKINILTEEESTKVFEKLNSTNNAFFKTMENVVGISFSKDNQ